jgi:hypothetical protein
MGYAKLKPPHQTPAKVKNGRINAYSGTGIGNKLATDLAECFT